MTKRPTKRQPPKRRSGRPDADATRKLDRRILVIARRMFIEHGYAASSMEQVALRAGAGKQTIYRRYPSKRSLFAAVLEDLGGGLGTGATLAQTASSDPLAGLREVCRAMLETNTKPETIAIYRVLIAESQRFPKLVEHT